MKDNKLDKFFREKSEEKLPEFDPKYWEQAERMLDDALPEQADRRRRAWWWWLPLLLIGGCGVCWFSPLGKDRDWMKTDKKVLISEDKLDEQEGKNVQTDFENKIKKENIEEGHGEVGTDASKENTNSITNNKTIKSVNTKANNSNSLKNAIADIGQNDAPIRRSEEFFNEKNSTKSQVNNFNQELSPIPTETPETRSTDIGKTPDLTATLPILDEELKEGKELPKIEFLQILETDYLESRLVEIEDSLKIYPMKLKGLGSTKKLRLGWSTELVAREEIAGDVILTKVASFRTGLTMDYKLSKRWDLHFDFLVRRETSESVQFVNAEEPEGGKAYGFGVTQITNLYRFKTQYFLEGVGLFRYKLHERHSIGAGIGLKYLLSVRADLIQRQEEIVFDFEEYSVFFDDRDELIDSGWWEKRHTKDLLPFAQFRYDYRPSRNFTLFFKLNGEYNGGWYQRSEDVRRYFGLETAFGFNYQF